MAIVKVQHNGQELEIDEELLALGKEIVAQLDDDAKNKLYRWIKAMQAIRSQPYYG